MKHTAKAVFSLILAAAAALSLAACTQPSSSSSPQPGAQPVPSGSAAGQEAEDGPEKRLDFVSFAANTVGQTAYTQAAGICDLINNGGLGVSATAEETNGALQNAKLMIDGDVEFGFINNMILANAYNAAETFEGSEAHRVYGFMTLDKTEMHAAVPKGSAITSLQELKGKRVGIGQPGGISIEVTQAMLSVLGYSEQDLTAIQVGLPEMCDMLGNGQLDAILWIGSSPLPKFKELGATTPLTFLDVPQEAVDGMIAENPNFKPCVIRAGTYDGQERDLNSFCLMGTISVSADVPEETMYQIAKLVMENLDALKEVHPSFGNVGKDSVLAGFTTPVHPGALRYYREIGAAGAEDR